MTRVKILVTGVTGYVGGTVLAGLLSSNNDSVKGTELSALVRTTVQLEVLKSMGVQTHYFNGFQDLDRITEVASEHDIIIHTASGYDTACARALMAGLADRKKRYGSEVYYIHTSGSTSLANSPKLGLYPSYPDGVFSDQNSATVVSTLRSLNSCYSYAQRLTDLTVIAGSEIGVNSLIVMLPMLYGEGKGAFNRSTGQVSMVIQSAIEDGYVCLVEDGSGVKGHVHIVDAANVFELLLIRILEGLPLTYGPEGIIFVEDGCHSWKEITAGIAKAGHELGALSDETIKSISIDEAVIKFDWNNAMWSEVAFVSSSRISADKARAYGWKPQSQPTHFANHYVDEWRRIIQKAGVAVKSGRPTGNF